MITSLLLFWLLAGESSNYCVIKLSLLQKNISGIDIYLNSFMLSIVILSLRTQILFFSSINGNINKVKQHWILCIRLKTESQETMFCYSEFILKNLWGNTEQIIKQGLADFFSRLCGPHMVSKYVYILLTKYTKLNTP